MRFLFITFTAGLILAFGLGAASPAGTPPPDQLRWYSIEEVIQIKKDNPDDDKAIFIDVYTDWCGWCKRMDATTFSNQAVQAILAEEFYPVKFDAEQKEAITFDGKEFKFVPQGRRGYHELAATLLQGKMSYPTMVLMDADFNMIQPLPGYRGAKEMLPILHFIGKGAYQEKSWSVFYADWQQQNG